ESLNPRTPSPARASTASTALTASTASTATAATLAAPSRGFDAFGLRPELLRAVADLGFDQPTPIQAKGIPPALEGRDVLACAMTGSGQTAAFGRPLLTRLR